MTNAEYVERSDLADAELHVAEAPLPSLLMAMRDAAGADRSGTPEAWRRVIRAHLTRRDYEVLAPLCTDRPTVIPSALVPCPGPGGQTLKDALEQIVGCEDVLVSEIHACLGSGSAGDWRAPAQDPARWVRGYVLALARAWAGFRPIWQAAADRLEAEAERVAAAAERGAHLHLVGDLLPCGHVDGDRWLIEWTGSSNGRLRVGERGLTLVPLVAGSRAGIVDGDGETLWLVGYSLRRRANGDGASLEALLGAPRARILRELGDPATNNRLASLLHTVPSAATYHVSALVSAGLVIRDRSDGTLMVRRTPRGDALLALYDA